jgi:hypothetical protein
VRERDIIGNIMPENMVAAEKRLEELGEATNSGGGGVRLVFAERAAQITNKVVQKEGTFRQSSGISSFLKASQEAQTFRGYLALLVLIGMKVDGTLPLRSVLSFSDKFRTTIRPYFQLHSTPSDLQLRPIIFSHATKMESNQWSLLNSGQACAICPKINFKAMFAGNLAIYALGTLQEMAQRDTCPTCKLFIRAVEHAWFSSSSDTARIQR